MDPLIYESEGTANEEHSPSPLKRIDHTERKLIVTFLPTCLRHGELNEIFSQAGEVESVQIPLDRSSGQSLCYGFVVFSDIESANRAIFLFDGMRLYTIYC
jgi:RNA recognition motif-containing protein